ncbi:hypothetical protein ACN263_06440 [Micromonospora sp. WMMD729]|uniref:hypothetical protein n=1 Tax=Micromonospora sp. WMMD729 TaxID=3404127 RepID=UPI003BF4D694
MIDNPPMVRVRDALPGSLLSHSRPDAPVSAALNRHDIRIEGVGSPPLSRRVRHDISFA